MLLILVIILLLLWSSVVWSIYSNFMVFYSNFFESENYHKAYYASISALERWELVTKQRQPWYIWSWGFIMWEWKWSYPDNSDWWSDKSLSWFSYLWNDENQTSVFRSVNSRTTRIPANWKWDIEWTLSYEDADNPNNPDNSNNYNKMDYENSEVFLLYYDTSRENPYTYGTITKSNPTQITWEIRLPKLLKNDFWQLNTGIALVWQWGSMPKNDAIVDRQIRWTYWTNDIPFTIYSTQVIDWVDDEQSEKELPQDDSVIRENDINYDFNFKFWNTNSPFTTFFFFFLAKITIISQNEKDILNSIWTHWIIKVFEIGSDFNKTQLRFSLLNLLRWKDTNLVYPFLEYYTDFWTIVPDKYYTINGEWNFKDYQINTIIQKPTVKETILWSFTSIFW